MKTIKTLMAGIILLASLPTLAQDQKPFQLAENAYSIQIEGTSNVHDWTMEAEQISGTALAQWSQNSLAGFKAVKITVPAQKIESGKRIMNKKTYDALQAEKHPKITFELISVKNLKTSAREFSGTATGTLKMAGESSIVSIPFKGKILDDNTFQVNGNFSLKMTEFGIDPPTAMLGTLKTGDQITLNYQMTFKN